MKKLTMAILGLALICAIGGCQSDDHVDSSAAVPCICGTPEADVSGCPCDLCARQGGNPDNPKCICAPLGGEGVQR